MNPDIYPHAANLFVLARDNMPFEAPRADWDAVETLIERMKCYEHGEENVEDIAPGATLDLVEALYADQIRFYCAKNQAGQAAHTERDSQD